MAEPPVAERPVAERIVIVSNGHGEDAVGAALAEALVARGVQIGALPLVGRGEAYGRLGFPVFGPRRELPSGGFVFERPGAFWQDVRAGFLGMTARQWTSLAQVSRQASATVVVGDWYALSLASLWGARPLFQMQPLVSLRYWRGEGAPTSGQPYGRWERFLMRRARRVYARDPESALWLERHGVPQAVCLGNPMLDALYGDAELGLEKPFLLLLPGSRTDAYESAPVMLEACRILRESLTPALTPVMAWASLPLEPLFAVLNHWRLEATSQGVGVTHQVRHPDGTLVHLVQHGFKTALLGARLALSTSGTAAEQAVGYGVPVVAFPTGGPQYTRLFALGQKRLLGAGLTLSAAEPQAVAQAARDALALSEQALRRAGLEAMGVPGAAARIACDIMEQLGSLQPLARSSPSA